LANRLLCRKNLIKISGFHFEPVTNVVKLNELHFIAINNLAEVQLGADLLWYHYTQAFKQVISKTNTSRPLSIGRFNPKQTTSGKRKGKSGSKLNKKANPTLRFTPVGKLLVRYTKLT